MDNANANKFVHNIFAYLTYDDILLHTTEQIFLETSTGFPIDWLVLNLNALFII